MPSQREKDAISGITAGTLTTIINHPLDLIKIRLQLDTHSVSQSKSLQNIIKDLISSSSKIPSVYRGLGINIVGNGVSWGLYFTIYNDLKSSISYFQSPYQNYLCCSFLTGSVVTLITNPIWVLKTRILATNKTEPNAYKSAVDGAIKIFKNEGLSTFFKGFTPGLVSVCQGALYFTIYDSMKSRYNEASLSFGHYVYITSVAKIISTTCFYPFQLFKSRLQSIQGKHRLNSLVVEIYRNEGVGGFYKGLYVNLFRTLPASCVTFVSYEFMRRYLG